MSYDIEQHKHLFAAWAACRATSVVKGFRFPVETGRIVLEATGFDADFSDPDRLPSAADLNDAHRHWRERVVTEAAKQGIEFTHGLAAKLINVYLKCRFVCGGHDRHERVCCLHPPIDSGMLKSLAKSGKFAKEWRRDCKTGWSSFTSEQYEAAIARVRRCLKEGEALWMIEEHWKGQTP